MVIFTTIHCMYAAWEITLAQAQPFKKKKDSAIFSYE